MSFDGADLRIRLINIEKMLGKLQLSSTKMKVEELNFGEVLTVLWIRKWLIIVITGLFTIVSVIYSVNIPNEYKSTAVIVPNSQSGSSGLSQLSGQLGGIASIAGINLGNSGGGKELVAIELLKSWGFLEKFIADNNIQLEVLAANGWEQAANRLTYNSEIYDEKTKSWALSNDANNEIGFKPSSWKLYEKLSRRISVNLDKNTGFVHLSVEYYSPQVAKDWVDKLIVAINLYIQEQDKEVAKKSIEYLKEKINRTNVSEMQSVFYQLIEEQTKTLMLTEVSDEYVFRTISEAKVPEVKSRPKRALICVLGFMVGFIVSTSLVLLTHVFGNDV
jgi:uncharacterized protein involved in exopolysaccharide biosynthesis